MKWIKYKLNEYTEKGLSYSEENLVIAEKEAVNGEYTIEDDGIEEPESEPTAEDMMNAMLRGLGYEQ